MSNKACLWQIALLLSLLINALILTGLAGAVGRAVAMASVADAHADADVLTVMLRPAAAPAKLASLAASSDAEADTRSILPARGGEENPAGSAEVPQRMSGPGYLPASLLTERPMILNDIDDSLSQRFSGLSPRSLRLLLLINEYGDVDRVLFDKPDDKDELPEVLIDDLRQRFLAARFLPGRLHAQPVRSALRIAVDLQ